MRGRKRESSFGPEHWGVGAFYPAAVRKADQESPLGLFGPGRVRWICTGVCQGSGCLRGGSLPPAVALAACAPAAEASHRGWETRSLPGGADYQQLLLLSPARISLPQPTASPWARSPPAPPSPSPPPPVKLRRDPGYSSRWRSHARRF